MFGSLKTIAKQLRGKTTAEREMDYLCEARDTIELEYRQRQVDRGLFRARAGNFL